MSHLIHKQQLLGVAYLLSCGLIFLLVACSADQQVGINETMDLELTVTSDKSHYAANEPILVTVNLHNSGTQTITVNGRLLLNHATAPEFARDLYFEITGPENYSNRNLFRVNAGAPRAEDLVELAPDGIHQRTIELTRFHSLHLPGQYTLVAHYLSASAVAGFDVWQGSLQSNALVLERR